MLERQKHSLKLYVEERYHPGGYLEAVLSNDLFGAYHQADEESRENMYELIKYIYNNLPSGCWGSKEAVKRWLTGEQR